MTAVCLYCQISGRKPSRIPCDAQDRCLKNRNGTCPACNQLTDIDRKINEARRVVEVLLAEREALVSALNEHHDPFVRHLPPEIVSRIFVSLKPVNPSTDIIKARFNEKATLKAVFTPGRVCKDWRRIARDTPKLWTTLSTTITQSNCILSIPMVQDWLERSGRLSLYLHIAVQPSPSKLVTQTAQKVIASTIMHAHRWEVLDIEVPSELLPYISKSLLKMNLDRLQHIKTRYFGNWDYTDVLHLSATPRRLTLDHGHFSQISVNYEKITHITLVALSLEDAKTLFENALQLLSCTCNSFGREGLEREYLLFGPRIFAPSLRILSVAEALAGVWDHFEFPSLETLSVRWPVHEDDGNQGWANIMDLLRRSGCRIRELEIKESTECSAAIFEVLKVTPDLQQLSFEGDILNGPLFSLLDRGTTSIELMEAVPDFLGKLRSLSCSTYDDAHDWCPLIGFLSSMTSKSKRSLQSFKFQYMWSRSVKNSNPDLGKDVLKPLLDAVCGLEVKILDFKGRDMLKILRSSAP